MKYWSSDCSVTLYTFIIGLVDGNSIPETMFSAYHPAFFEPMHPPFFFWDQDLHPPNLCAALRKAKTELGPWRVESSVFWLRKNQWYGRFSNNQWTLGVWGSIWVKKTITLLRVIPTMAFNSSHLTIYLAEAKATPKCNVCQYLFAMISLDWLCKHQTKVFTLLSVETKFLQSQPHAPISFLAVKCCLCEASLLTAAEIPQRQSLRHENLFLQALQHPQNENNS